MHYKFIAFIANYEETIPPFANLIRRIEIRDYRARKMLSVSSRIPKKKGGTLQPVLPLIPEKLPTAEEEKNKFISFELKMQVGQGDVGTKYKKSVRIFEEENVQQWIDLLRDLKEIWRQNSISGGSDQAATVRSLIKGESATAFESALQEKRMDKYGEELPISEEHVQGALEAVSSTVFPHRALEIQRLWMNR